MKLEMLLDKKARFTELVRIKNFTNVKNCLKQINTFFEFEKSEGYYSDNKENHNYKYVYLSGDGQAYFVEELNEFDEDFRTEQDWRVHHSFPMN